MLQNKIMSPFVLKIFLTIPIVLEDIMMQSSFLLLLRLSLETQIVKLDIIKIEY